MVGQRLRRLRLARGMTLQTLAMKMGGIVTKQALSKYEHDKAQPSPLVLSRLGSALGVKAAYLCAEPSINVTFVAYRRGASLSGRDRSHIEALVEEVLEQRVLLQELVGQHDGVQLPINRLHVDSAEDAEAAAEQVRETWGLGTDPICDLTATLEDRLLCVLEASTSEDFEGLSAVARDDEGNIKAAAIVTRSDTAGERQRLNLAHELGHLALAIPEHVDEEKAAFRFGGAFLAPRNALVAKLGSRRALVQADELMLLKKEFGISIQALLFRLHDLHIISDSHYRQWWTEIELRGWKRQEPFERQREQPQWLRRTALRLIAEGLMSKEQAESMLREDLHLEEPSSVIERRAFMRLPLEKRRQILAEQAQKAAKYYAEEADRSEGQGGDFIDY